MVTDVWVRCTRAVKRRHITVLPPRSYVVFPRDLFARKLVEEVVAKGAHIQHTFKMAALQVYDYREKIQERGERR